MPIIENALDQSLISGKNLVIIGPPIGKSSRIEAWAEDHHLNAFDVLPYIYRSVAQEDTAKGILVIDSPTIYELETEYPNILHTLLTNPASIEEQFMEHGYQRPEILFSVVVLAEYPENEKGNKVALDIIGDNSNWQIVNVTYDKNEQLPYFIEFEEIVIMNLEDRIEEAQNDPTLSSDPSYNIETLKHHIECASRRKKIFEHLLESPLFDTKPSADCPEIDSFILGEWHSSLVMDGKKDTLLQEVAETKFFDVVSQALSDYTD